MMGIWKRILASALRVGASQTQALLIDDIELDDITFTVDEFLGVSGNWATGATGTSNSLGYTLNVVDPQGFFLPLSNDTGSQAYNDIPNRRFDDLHLGLDFAINFDAPISALLVALANNSSEYDGPDLGVAPVDVIDVTVEVGGTQVFLDDRLGGLALYEFDPAKNVVVHINDVSTPRDGWDVSFFAFVDVPVPACASFKLSPAGHVLSI